jgi:hypothetical protein
MATTAKISEHFYVALLTGGADIKECGLCGRTHFSSQVRKKAEQYPEKYFEHPNDSVSWGMIDGKLVVLNCPCDKLAKYEEYIWTNRSFIARYLELRGGAEFMLAEPDEAAIAALCS